MFNSRQSLSILTAIGLFWFALLSLVAEAQTGTTPSTEAAPTQSASPVKGINLWQPGDPGQPLIIQGRVVNTLGDPVVGAELKVWQADGSGEYQPDRYRASLRTDKDGRYGFGTVLPGQYYGVKHIHLIVTHESYGSIETQIVFMGDPNLDESTERDRAIFLEDANIDGETYLFGRFDIVLQAAGG